MGQTKRIHTDVQIAEWEINEVVADLEKRLPVKVANIKTGDKVKLEVELTDDEAN